MKTTYTFFHTLILLTLLSIAPAHAQDAVGQALAISGACTASDSANTTRNLDLNGAVFAGDTLRTGAGAKLQVRFADGSMIMLRENTEFRVDQFRYRAGAKDGTSVMSLVKGGFRTVTGLVARLKPDSYKVQTPVATIGVRGTHYEAALGDGLDVAVWEGTISLDNKSGTTLLGDGAPFKYAHVADDNSAPQGSDEPPPTLGGKLDMNEPGNVVNPPPGDTNIRPQLRDGQITDGQF